MLFSLRFTDDKQTHRAVWRWDLQRLRVMLKDSLINSALSSRSLFKSRAAALMTACCSLRRDGGEREHGSFLNGEKTADLLQRKFFSYCVLVNKQRTKMNHTTTDLISLLNLKLCVFPVLCRWYTVISSAGVNFNDAHNLVGQTWRNLKGAKVLHIVDSNVSNFSFILKRLTSWILYHLTTSLEFYGFVYSVNCSLYFVCRKKKWRNTNF